MLLEGDGGRALSGQSVPSLCSPFSIRAGWLVTQKHRLSHAAQGQGVGWVEEMESLEAQDLRQSPHGDIQAARRNGSTELRITHVTSSGVYSAASPVLGRCHSEGQEFDFVSLWLLWPPPRVWASHPDRRLPLDCSSSRGSAPASEQDPWSSFHSHMETGGRTLLFLREPAGFFQQIPE